MFSSNSSKQMEVVTLDQLVPNGTVQNPIIGKTLGHKSSEATKVYSRMNIDPVKKGIEGAVELMNEFRDG